MLTAAEFGREVKRITVEHAMYAAKYTTSTGPLAGQSALLKLSSTAVDQLIRFIDTDMDRGRINDKELAVAFRRASPRVGRGGGGGGGGAGGGAGGGEDEGLGSHGVIVYLLEQAQLSRKFHSYVPQPYRRIVRQNS